VLLCGYGALGRRIAARCIEGGIAITAVHHDPDIEAVPGMTLVFGDPTRGEVLEAAGIADARLLVVADLLLGAKIQVCTQARRLNPRIVISGSANTDAERAWLEEFGAQFVSDGRDEQSAQMARAIKTLL
jgi:CPA2 family monovalent cation:H+ antiporter-2